jgi:hypothetical protein
MLMVHSLSHLYIHFVVQFITNQWSMFSSCNNEWEFVNLREWLTWSTMLFQSSLLL